MPQILIVGASDTYCFEVQALAQRAGVRSKFTFDIGFAEEWLNLGGFSALIIDPKLGVDIQQKLGNLLWTKDMVAPLILFGEEASSGRDAESRLFGAQAFTGSDARSRLEKTFKLLIETSTKGPPNEVLHVAVVEDLDSPRDIICTYLEGVDNVRTYGFSGVDSAYESLSSEPTKFDCVLTDLRMPKKTGVDLITMIRADPALEWIPVIVPTAYGTADILLDCLKAGATGFLVKPPKKHDLKRELARARRLLRFKLDPRLVFPNEVEKMREILQSKGFA